MRYCSLGFGCHLSIVLKRLELKKESFPFDWLNSRPSIVKDCILDDFKIFLDKSHYSELDYELYKEDCCQHDIYASHILDYDNLGKNVVFRHRNPLKNENDYNYYIRCVNRFRDLLYSKEFKYFFIMFPNRDNDTFETLKESILLVDVIKKYTNNFKLIAIHHQRKGNQSIQINDTDTIKFIKLHTISYDEGGNFLNKDDNDFIANVVRESVGL